MAKKKSEDASPSKLKPMIGAVVLVVVGAVLGGKVLGGGGQPAAEATAPTTTVEPAGVITALEPITLNLADGRFLKLGLAFEVRHDAVYPEVAEGGHGGGGEDPTMGFAREVDVAITVMSSYTFEELIAADGKEMAKRRLLEELQKVSHDAIEDVLFHEFVMQ